MEQTMLPNGILGRVPDGVPGEVADKVPGLKFQTYRFSDKVDWVPDRVPDL